MTRSPRFARPSIAMERRADGVLVLRSRAALDEHPAHLGLVLRGRAEREPERIFLAERHAQSTRRARPPRGAGGSAVRAGSSGNDRDPTGTVRDTLLKQP
jgi:hypothetical protein